MSLLLDNQVVLGQLGENFDAILDHQVVHGKWSPVRAPHDATELGASLDKVTLLCSKNARKQP